MIESNLNNIKRDLMAEIHEIKEQLKNSVDMQLKKMIRFQHPTKRSRPEVSVLKTRRKTLLHLYHRRTHMEKTIPIAGDDTTSVRSPRLMTDNNMTVKIKTHRNGRVSTVKDMLVKLADENSDYLKILRAVVLHAGAGNIADAETSESVTEELKTVADTIRNVNPEAKD